MTRRPRLIAHRGDARRFPENTLAAVRGAVDAGARYAEVDVHLTADGVPVVIHDPDLRRVAGRPERVADLTAAALADICVGEPARFGDAHRDARAPTLAALTGAMDEWPHLHLFVEIKPAALVAFGRERVVDAVLDAVRSAHERVTVISFDLDAVHRARARGAASVGWVLPRYDDATRARAGRLPAAFLFVDHTRLPPTPTALWRGPWHWAVYEVEDAARAVDLAARGAAFIETMDVSRLIAHPDLAPEGARRG